MRMCLCMRIGHLARGLALDQVIQHTARQETAPAPQRMSNSVKCRTDRVLGSKILTISWARPTDHRLAHIEPTYRG